ncbi:MAG: IclR family transcriptional regulator C-terminal domain-containing protein, partial [Candidatus Acidiferrum sp.]
RYAPQAIDRFSQAKIVLDHTRRHGYATDIKNFKKGLSGVAALVLCKDSRVVVAIGLASAAQRFCDHDLIDKFELARDFAAGIRTQLAATRQVLRPSWNHPPDLT